MVDQAHLMDLAHNVALGVMCLTAIVALWLDDRGGPDGRA